MKRTWGIMFIIFALLIGGFYGKRVYDKRDIISVRTTQAKEGEIKSYLSTSGVIKSKKVKEYYGAQLRIKEVKVSVGEEVQKGQLLITYDTSDIETSVKQAELTYENALQQQKELKKQKIEVDEKISKIDAEIANLQNGNIENNNLNDFNYNISSLVDSQMSSNFSSDAILDTDKSYNLSGGLPNNNDNKLIELQEQKKALSSIPNEKLQQMDNSVKMAKENVDIYKEKLSIYNQGIKADFNGVVTDIGVTEGSTANPMKPTITIQDINDLKIVVSLNKYDAGKVRVGQNALINSDNKEYKGEVVFINPVASSNASAMASLSGGDTTLGADIDISDETRELKINFDTDVDILIGEVHNVVKVPVEALRIEKNDKNYVFILNNDIAEKREVQIGLQSDTEVQIVKGIKKGETIILNPGVNINNGSKVKEMSE